RLVGVAGYEGAVAHDAEAGSLAAVDEFLRQLRALHDALEYETDTPMATAGGSQYFDQVADVLGPLSARGVEVVLRAGSYVAHDDDLYARMTPVARGRGGPALRPALRALATVLSRPEPDLAILDAGRRDLPFDCGLPIPLDLPGAAVVELNDHHALVRGAVSGVEVGSTVRLGVSHPCTAFDKWSLIPVVDDEEAVVDAVRTFF
ncbi:MAG: amino acid deaminase, partial [Stackebrandtia sp.]